MAEHTAIQLFVVVFGSNSNHSLPLALCASVSVCMWLKFSALHESRLAESIFSEIVHIL